MNIKEIIKKNLNSGKRIDVDSLYESVKGFDHISFDIFDTLVKRNVERPTDIFSIMEKKVGVGFKEKRIESERLARKNNIKKEITIEDIYDYFPELERKNLIELEMSIELNAIVPNIPVAEVYKKCIKDGKKIYITSDIYWSESAVKNLLEKKGFVDYVGLYISSKENKIKSDGSLFRKLLEQEHISPKQLIHIGDTNKSDYYAPRLLGITAVKIPRYFKNISYRGEDKNDSIELNYLNYFINNSFYYTEDPYYQFGYSQFGKFLYGYVRWIYEQAKKRDLKKIFFFSRDGYIIKKAYEMCISDNSIDITYLEVSRRSLRVPILWLDCSYETILKMLVNSKLVSLQSLFDGLGIELNN